MSPEQPSRPDLSTQPDSELQSIITNHTADLSLHRPSSGMDRELDDAPGLRNFAIREQAAERVRRIAANADRYREAVRVLTARMEKSIRDRTTEWLTKVEEVMRRENGRMRTSAENRPLYAYGLNTIDVRFLQQGLAASIEGYQRITTLLPEGSDERRAMERSLKGAASDANDQASRWGMDLLYTCGTNGENFRFLGFQMKLGYQIDNLMHPYRQIVRDADSGKRKEDAEVRDARERMRTMDVAREYREHDPEAVFYTKKREILTHFTNTRQRAPDYVVNTSMPDPETVRELEWAYSSMFASEENQQPPYYSTQLVSEMETELMALGIMSGFRKDTDIRHAQIGQRRTARPDEGDRGLWIFEKRGDNDWRCDRQPGLSWSDAMMASRTLNVRNPRHTITFRKVSAGTDTNGVLQRARMLDSYRDAMRSQRASVDSSNPEYNRLSYEMIHAEVDANRLRRYNETLRLPPERLLRHKIVELSALILDGYDERSPRIVQLNTEINALFTRVVRDGKADTIADLISVSTPQDARIGQVRTARDSNGEELVFQKQKANEWQCISPSHNTGLTWSDELMASQGNPLPGSVLRLNGFQFETIRISGDNPRTEYRFAALTARPDDMRRSEWNSILRRRGDIESIRAMVTALVAVRDAGRDPSRTIMDAYDRTNTDVVRRYTELQQALAEADNDTARATARAETDIFAGRVARLMYDEGYNDVQFIQRDRAWLLSFNYEGTRLSSERIGG